ncbi:hypothetical protein [Actinomadura roseirufa]|uniref:hypothetical protein n=1 Tax=Actinomadura roseirufa TaxID=2094049 RepID=UPI001041B00A|nr:hypothetical protein [Actinomadura roseirufa]
MAGPYARSSWVLALACAGALTACDGGSGSAKPPHSLPAPRASTPPSPAAPPSASPAKDSPAGERLVLRWRETGGLVGKGGPGSLPDFSLYSSGRAVTASDGKMTEYRLKPGALRRLLDEARAAGLDRSRTTAPGRVADAFALEFTMGGAHTKIVQAEARADPAVRFRERLDPRAWPAADLAAPGRPYAPARVAVLASEGTGGTPRAWPLAPLGRGRPVPGGVCTLAASGRIPATSPDTTWRSQGKTYTVRLRPLLPGETACDDLG